MTDILKNSLKLNLHILCAIGLYPSEMHNYMHRWFAYILHAIAVLPPFVLAPLNFFLSGAIERDKSRDLVTVGIILLGPKLFCFLLNRDAIQKCVKYFDKAFAGAVDDAQRTIIESSDKICRRNSTFFLSSVGAALLGFYVTWYLQDYHTQLPLNIWIPFNSETHPVLYCSVYFTLVIGTTYAALGCATIDPLVPGLFSHASGQLKLLKYNLSNLDSYVDQEIANCSSQLTRAIVIYRKIIASVSHYKKIIHFISECENCFSAMVFCQFIESMLVIGLGCLQLIKMQDDLNAYVLATVANLIAVLFQCFFYCYYGTDVFEENNSVCTAIYMSNWYEYDIVSRRALLILMERSKRPMLLRAGKVLDLSLETFTMILKSSYSLIAVLQNY